MKLPPLRWLVHLGIVASFGLIGWFLWRHLDELRAVNWRTMATPMLFSLGLYGLALGVQGAVWIGLFTQLTAASWSWTDVRMYFATHLMRRLPGAPWYMVGRAIAYRERSPSAARAALFVSLLEWAGIILTGLVWVAWGCCQWIGLLSSLILLLGILPLLQNWQWLVRWIPLKHLSLRNLYCAFLAYEVQWFLAALMLYLFLSSLSPVRTPNFLETGTLWAISNVLSSLAIFVPMGLGIRELSLVALLAPRVGLGYAAITALLMRVLFTLGDLIWSMIAAGLLPRINTSPRPDNP